MQSLQAVPEMLVSSPLLLWAKIIRFTDISDRETRRSVHNWCETTSCSEFKSEKGSCSPKNWIYPTLVIKKWFQELTADHKNAILPTCEKEANRAEKKGENSHTLVLRWNFSRLPRWQNGYIASALKSQDGCCIWGRDRWSGSYYCSDCFVALNSHIFWKQRGKQAASQGSSTLHPSSTALHYFPFSLVGTAWSWPQPQFFIPGMVALHSAHTPDEPGAELSCVSFNNP